MNWWAARLLSYNLWVFAVGCVTAVALLLTGSLELNLFFLPLQAALWLGAANLGYWLGPLADLCFNRNDSSAFRRRLYRLGLMVSLLPLALPVCQVLDAESWPVPNLTRASLAGRWISTRSLKGVPIGDDTILLREDGTYQHSYAPGFPGEREESSVTAGRWQLQGTEGIVLESFRWGFDDPEHGISPEQTGNWHATVTRSLTGELRLVFDPKWRFYFARVPSTNQG